MKNLDFEWLTDEFMLYCRSTQLREKTMKSYEQTLRLYNTLPLFRMNALKTVRAFASYLCTTGIRHCICASSTTNGWSPRSGTS